MAELMAARVTIYLAWKLFAPRTAAALKDGDVAEEKIRQLLLSEFQKNSRTFKCFEKKGTGCRCSVLRNRF